MTDDRQIIECEIDFIVKVNIEVFEDEDIHDVAQDIRSEIDGAITEFDPVWLEVDLDRVEVV